MTQPIRTVLFDLDDTLLQYRRSSGRLLRESFAAVGVDPVFSVEAYYEQFRRFADRTDSVAELRRECFAALCADRGRDPDLGRRVADVYADERDHRDVEWVAGARDVIESFSDRYRLGVVTNSPPDSGRQKIDAAGVDAYVETVVFAGDDAPAKPATEPFDRALEALDTDHARAVHVGDSRQSDVAGANAAGLRSVLFAADGDDGGSGNGDESRNRNGDESRNRNGDESRNRNGDGDGGDRQATPDDRIASMSELGSLPWVES